MHKPEERQPYVSPSFKRSMPLISIVVPSSSVTGSSSSLATE